jgi:hypothetical protein
MITEKIKAELIEWGYELVSENPLIIKEEYSDIILSGLPAKFLIDEIIEEIEYTEGDVFDFSSLDKDSFLLVTVNANYADEFDMSEWSVMTVGKYEEIVEKLEAYDDEIEIGFGTNEEFRFNNGKDLLSNFDVKPISIEEADVLFKLFDGSFDGGSGIIDYVDELENDNDEDDEDEDDDDESILDKSDIRQIEKLKGFGWDINIHDKERYLLKYEDSEGNISISGFSVLYELIDYYRKNKQ